jgi:hypothetical protein
VSFGGLHACMGARRAVDLTVRVPERPWQRLSGGHGAKGERWYDRALVDTADPAVGEAGQHWLLIRCHRKTGEYAFDRAGSAGSAGSAVSPGRGGRAALGD